jgi:hypothetical protein
MWAWHVRISPVCCSSPTAEWSLGLNIGADKEAAEHFLSALSLQDTINGDSSNQLWYTLRRALVSMVRRSFFSISRHFY